MNDMSTTDRHLNYAERTAIALEKIAVLLAKINARDHTRYCEEIGVDPKKHNIERNTNAR